MRVLICGSRVWADEDMIERVVGQLEQDTVVIHGCARGADLMAANAANRQGKKQLGFPAQWDKYGKRAGYLRNTQMLVEGKPDLVIAFIKCESRGTRMMVDIARKANVAVNIYNEEGDKS